MTAATPPGWPPSVLPPAVPEWRRTAVSWLLDNAPPEYRSHPVLRQFPLALAHLVGEYAAGSLESTRRARATARTALTEHLPPPALVEVIEVLDAEEARLIGLGRAVALVTQALQGRHFVPRL